MAEYKLPRYYESDIHQVSYLRIPKTASTSIVKALDLKEVEEPQYKLFTVIRNPIDRAVSMYHECQRSGHYQTETLERWLHRVIKQGYYDSHASLMMSIIKECKYPVEVLDMDEIQLLEEAYHVTLPKLNATTERIKPNEDEMMLIFQAFSKDFLYYIKMIR